MLQHVKTYFPQAYKDFNETSPGMMLVELSAYVGDILNYYVDDSFKELLLPLSEDRRNLINLSKVTGDKPNAIVPSFVDLRFTLSIDADSSDVNNIVGLSSQKLTLSEGISVTSTSNPNLVFETLEPLDFSVGRDTSEAFVVDTIDSATGLVSKFKATRTIKAVSGETKSITFVIGAPEQYKKIKLPDLNVIEIISCIDSNKNAWYEVDYLAQENIAIQKYYTADSNRTTSIESSTDGSSVVPSSLSFIKTSKRFIKEVNEDNTTSLVFGNGLIKNGKEFETTFLDVEQEGVTLPTTVFSPKPLDPTIGTYYASLGEAPQNITLTIKYRAGGGIASNVQSSDLITIKTAATIPAGESISNLSVTNNLPAVGGKEGDFTEEIRQGALSNYAAQNRCVTKQDFEARCVSMPPKFGSIAKVFCATGGTIDKNTFKEDTDHIQKAVNELMSTILGSSDEKTGSELQNVNLNDPTLINLISGTGTTISKDDKDRFNNLFNNMKNYIDTSDYNPTVDIYILSYDINKKLIAPPDLIIRNLKSYLNEFRLLSDKIRILPGFVINFGIAFDVMTFPGYDKSVIKNKCIDALKAFYSIESMKFKQVLYTADTMNLLNGIEGIKAVNDIIFTQDINFFDDTTIFSSPLYSKSVNQDGDTITINDRGYSHTYDFAKFFSIKDSPAGRGVVLPSFDPAVFEIKNPDLDIKGVVR